MSEQFNPRYVFRDDAPDFFQRWPSDDETEFIHARCAETMWDREFPVYRDEMPENTACAVCERLLWKPKNNLIFRYQLFRAFGNGVARSLKKALGSGQQYLYPTRW